MSNWLFNYRIQFKGAEDNAVEIVISDTEQGQGIATYYELLASEDPFHLFTVNNDETKFGSPIRALQCEVKFYSTALVNLTTFLGSNDNRWIVTATSNGSTVFTGYLLLDDIEEDFLDSSIGNEVTLIATDNIGMLKDIPLTDFTGANPRGYFPIIKYIAWCLDKTGLQLPINICHNVHEEHEPTKIMYESCYLWSKSFEAEINESEDCYTVLEKILAEDSFLTQAGGEWWVKRIDEFGYSTTIQNKFSDIGTYISSLTYPSVTQTIGPNEAILFSGMATFIKPQAPDLSVKETYNFDYPKEIIDNVDFDRGAWISPLHPDGNPYVLEFPNLSDFPGTGDPERVYHAFNANTYYRWNGSYTQIFGADIPTSAAYQLEGWTIPNQQWGAAQEVSAYIKKITDLGYERMRFLVLEPLNYTTVDYYVQSNRIPINSLDKFVISVDTRYDNDISGQTEFWDAAIRVILEGYDGSLWYLYAPNSSEPRAHWVRVSPGATYTTSEYVVTRLSEDQTEWLSHTVTASPSPTTGEIYIHLQHGSYQTHSRIKYFQNLQFTYMPCINGTYQKYKGQYNKVSQSKTIKKKHEEEVKISDSPRSLFKGALHRYNGTRYVLAGRVYDGIQFGSTVPAADYLTTFGKNQAFAIWNQSNRPFRVFDFQLQGLNTLDVMPTMLHEYTINETTEHTTGKRFMLLHFDMDYKLCEWKGVMSEVADEAIPKVYNDSFESKYITER